MMNKFFLSPIRLGYGIVLCAVLAGCGGNGGSTPGSRNGARTNPDNAKLVIISPYPDSVKKEFERAFKKSNPGVSIQWQRPAGATDSLRYISDRFKSKQSKDEGIGADVFFGGDLQTIVILEERGWLEVPGEYEIRSTLNGVPLRGEDNVWIAAALSGYGIFYNKQIASRDKLPVPVKWADLGKKSLQGKIALVDPRQNASAHFAYETILQTAGWEEGWKILAAIAGNARAFVKSNSQLMNEVSSGQVVFVPAIDYEARAKISAAGKNKFGYITPKGQSVMTPDAIAIFAGAKNKAVAQKFVKFVLSIEGQKLWMLPKGAPGGPQTQSLLRLPVRRTLYKSIPKGSLIETNPFSIKNERSYDHKRAAVRHQILDDLIGAILIDNHEALKARQRKSGDSNVVMLAPSNSEVKKSVDAWKDPAFRRQKLSEWRQAARTRIQWY